MKNEWKRKLEDYYKGNLPDNEVKQLEEELEKMDIYHEFLSNELEPTHFIKDHETEGDKLSPEKVTKILRNSMRNARFSLIAYIIMILLLIYPIATMTSYMYYGTANKGNDLIDVAIQTIYLTEPNVSLDEMNIEQKVGIFTFDVFIDLYKRVGRSDLKQGDWLISYQLSDAKFPKRNYISEEPPDSIPYFDTKKLFHPDAEETNVDLNVWDTLEKLPDGTVAEVYVSLNTLESPENMNKVTKELDLEWRWYAIDTGLEATGKGLEGGYIDAIGYPAQTDPDAWSPFNDRKPNHEQFMDSLYFLKKYEEQAVKIAHAKWLDLDYRINYLEENGFNVYAGVLTGPTKEILKLKNNDSVRSIHMGEVRLWNW